MPNDSSRIFDHYRDIETMEMKWNYDKEFSGENSTIRKEKTLDSELRQPSKPFGDWCIWLVGPAT